MADFMTQGERKILPELLETVEMIPEEKQQILLGAAMAIVYAGLHPDKKEEH